MKGRKISDVCFDFRHRYARKSTFWYFILTDAHWDNPKTNLKLLKRHLDLAKERDATIFIPGDFFCAMQGKYDKRGSKSSIRPEHNSDTYLDKIVETAAKWLEPYKDNIGLISPGNHETAVLKRSETDLTKRLANAIGCHHGPYQGFIRLIYEQESGGGIRRVEVSYHHGYGGGGPVTKDAIQANRKAVYLDSDIVISGHTHDRWVIPYAKAKLRQNGQVEITNQYHLKSGTYKDEFSSGNGWAIEKGMPPRSLGGAFIKITVGVGLSPDIQFEFPG